ncbi:hypothetical protein GH714_038688 [Hevea brasiliensis]|uniref:Uncharacterized protein n=1 Tax=Hevea brasiliensis TaxID=3981 RepID=A0A6A6N9R8_HEVBR|nr:hypothetical protein GH714_038688 [Hevea brasiliensis]
MSNEINYYDQLLILYENDRATGDIAETAKEKARCWSRKKSDSSGGNSVQVNQQLHLKLFLMLTLNLDDITSPKKKKRRSTTAKEINRMKEAIENVAEVLKEGNIIAKKRNEIVE